MPPAEPSVRMDCEWGGRGPTAALQGQPSEGPQASLCRVRGRAPSAAKSPSLLFVGVSQQATQSQIGCGSPLVP